MKFKPATIYKNTTPEDQRLGNLLVDSMEAADYVIQGYPDEEGIQNNGGRLGAAGGPEGVRNVFYKTTPHLELETPNIFDNGNLDISGSLFERHESVKTEVKHLLSKNKTVISIGGGHDYAYPDGAAFLEDANGQRPLIINFDAHLDLRPLGEKINSGTPFYRLLNEYPDQFDFLEIGLQQVCNSKHYYNWGKERGMQALWLEDFQTSGEKLTTYFLKRFESIFLKKPLTYISLDMDVFSSAYAPGASQSWPSGLEPNDFFPLFYLLIERLPVKILGIYEVAPALDENLKTQRLSAQIIHRFIYRY